MVDGYIPMSTPTPFGLYGHAAEDLHFGELNLDNLQVPDNQSTQHSESSVCTPSRWPTPKVAFDHRLQHVAPSLLSLALLRLLGSRVNPELRQC
jgi:hypothetical protein